MIIEKNISHRMTPDEAEFYDYLMSHNLNYFNDFIDVENHHIRMIFVNTKSRKFYIAFSHNKNVHEDPEYLLSFNRSHNHGHFLISNIDIKKFSVDFLDYTKNFCVYETENELAVLL